MKLLKLALVLPALLLCALAAHGKNLVKDPAYDKNGHNDFDTVDFTGDDLAGIADFVDGDRHSAGGQAVYLEAFSFDYSRVFSKIDKKEFDLITSVSFWYIQDNDPLDHNDLSPYVVLRVKIKGGQYDKGTLIIVGLGDPVPGRKTDWTFHEETMWHIQVYDKKGNLVSPPFGGTGVPLATIQAQYDGKLEDAGVAIGLFATDDTASATVDDFVVEIP